MRQRADTHVHTIYSGIGRLGPLKFPESVTRPEEMVDHARRKKLDVLCITDHNCIGGAFVAEKYARQFDDIDVVAGEEVSTADGEVVGLWLTEEIPKDLSIEETIDIIHSQGGLAIAPHPFSFHVPALREQVFDLKLEGIETLNGGHIDKYSNTKAKLEFLKHPGKWAQLGSSDGHSTSTVGYSWTEFDGQGADGLRKSILDKTTTAGGMPVPVDKAIVWSMEVVLTAGKMILRSLMGRLKDDPMNPLIENVKIMRSDRKLPAIIGAALYIIPPIPFIASIASNRWLNKNANKLVKEFSEEDLALLSGNRV